MPTPISRTEGLNLARVGAIVALCVGLLTIASGLAKAYYDGTAVQSLDMAKAPSWEVFIDIPLLRENYGHDHPPWAVLQTAEAYNTLNFHDLVTGDATNVHISVADLCGEAPDMVELAVQEAERSFSCSAPPDHLPGRRRSWELMLLQELGKSDTMDPQKIQQAFFELRQAEFRMAEIYVANDKAYPALGVSVDAPIGFQQGDVEPFDLLPGQERTVRFSTMRGLPVDNDSELKSHSVPVHGGLALENQIPALLLIFGLFATIAALSLYARTRAKKR